MFFGATALLVAVAADLWHAGVRRSEAELQVRSQMAPYADALRGAVERRFGLLAGFRSFVESRRSRGVLDEEFALFAEGTLTGTPGVRTVQLGKEGRIVTIWPIAGNESLVNFDIGPLDPEIVAAIQSGRPVVTGPITLVEGGRGLLLRQRITARPGFPDLATIILDVPALVLEAGIPDGRSGLRMEIRQRTTEWFGGDVQGSAIEPETLSVSVEGDDWSLLGSPVDGWEALTRERAVEFRLAAASLVAMFALLGLVFGDREARLLREVKARESRLDLVLRAGHMGVWEWDLSSSRVQCSEAVAGILGFDPSKVPDPDRRFFNSLHPDDRSMVGELLRATRAGERVSNVLECRVMRPDGTPRWILSISETERNADGRSERIYGVLSDATDRRNLEDRLRHAQRLEAVGTLAGGIAHDFNNLLTAMIGFGELAHDQADRMRDDPRAVAIRDDIAQVLATADRAASLTGQLLAFSRRSSTTPSRVDVTAVVREIEPMLGRLMIGTVELRCTLADGLPAIWMDSGQLTQVIMNLVVNARDAMSSGGTIWIRTSLLGVSGDARPADAPPGECVIVEVEDTGAGMTAEIQARIFEPYFTTKEIGRGTGLGLAVVYGAVEDAGGRTTVRSAPGEGTTLRVYLPPAAALPHDRTVP